MASDKSKSARLIAAGVLNQLDPKRNHASDILNKLIGRTKEKQRAADLVYGTIRNRSAIDSVIAKFADCPIERIPAKILNIIRIGAYELIYCPLTADYAIVNEAVEDAGAVAGKKPTGFVNAVLRQIQRSIKNRQSPITEDNLRRILPQNEAFGCEFNIEILPDPQTNPAEYLSKGFSLPQWLIVGWFEQLGFERARQVCLASNRRPSVYLRVNTLKTTIQQLIELFSQSGVDAQIVDDAMVTVKGPAAVTELPGFADGLFTVQDLTAYRVVKTLQPQPGWTTLDLCAAPGTKATQLAELTGDKAKIIATDINIKRLEKIKENTTRLGITGVKIVPYENTEKMTPFDCVLLDVPCSNTGVFAKRPEVRFRIKPKMVKELTKIQATLLQMAAAMTKPDGRICYSTCSIEKCENSDVVKGFLEKYTDFKLEFEQLTLPSPARPDHDGGYTAILVRTQM